MKPRLIVLLLALALAAGGCGDVVVFDPGDPADFVQQPQTSVVLDVDGDVLAELHTEQDRRDVGLDAVADVLEEAVIAIEDRRFLLHRGVDGPAILRALQANLEAGEIEQGGSTITQQYVKNAITGPAVTLERKVQEAIAAWQLEEQYSKAEILERYLNTVYFGKGAYGVRAASLTFFGHEPDTLTLDEAALLAGMIQSPSRYDPFEDAEAAAARREVVLDAMVDVGAIGRDEADEAAAAPIELTTLTEDRYRLPHVVEEVKRIIRDDPDGALADVLGSDADDRVAELFTGGLVVHTTIDPTMQAQAEQAVANTIPADDGPAAAVVTVEPGTGAIRAMVGGRDFYDETDPVARFNLATQGRRQPGSSFKPIVLAAALQRGSGLDRRFPGGACVEFDQFDPVWAPCNYGGSAYPEMSLREATIRSVNTVYARLGVEIGPTGVLETARSFGITSPLPQVPSLALGTGEVTPLEMAGAYSVFPALGRYTAPHLIERIETSDGEVLFRADPTSYRVIEQSTAFLVTQALQDVVERGTGVRASIGRPQAGKTGTSQDSADAWFVGYTPDLVTAVWIGFPEGRVPMVPPTTTEVVEGGRWPAQVWAAYMERALADVEPRPFEVPEVDLVTLEVDALRNCLPNPYTPADVIEVREYLRGTEPTTRCTEPTGPPVDDVPDIVGLPFDVAERLLVEQGFVLDVRPVVSQRYPPGIVAYQRPGPGQSTRPADQNAVVLWVSRIIRTQARVADVVGFPVADAVAVLESDGWVVFVERRCPATGCTGETRLVWGSTPAPDSVATEHSIVTVLAEPPGGATPTTSPDPDGTASPTPTATAEPSPTSTATPEPTDPTASPSPAPEPTPSSSSTGTTSPSPSPTGSETSSSTPGGSPSPTPSGGGGRR